MQSLWFKKKDHDINQLKLLNVKKKKKKSLIFFAFVFMT